MTEDKMVGGLHQLDGHELEQTPGDDEHQGKAGTLHSMGLQRVRHNLATEETTLTEIASSYQQLLCSRHH